MAVPLRFALPVCCVPGVEAWSLTKAGSPPETWERGLPGRDDEGCGGRQSSEGCEQRGFSCGSHPRPASRGDTVSVWQEGPRTGLDQSQGSRTLRPPPSLASRAAAKPTGPGGGISDLSRGERGLREGLWAGRLRALAGHGLQRGTFIPMLAGLPYSSGLR